MEKLAKMLAMADPDNDDDEEEDEAEDEEAEDNDSPAATAAAAVRSARSARRAQARQEFDAWLQELIESEGPPEPEDADQLLLGDGSRLMSQEEANGGEEGRSSGRWVVRDLGFGLEDEDEDAEEAEEEEAEEMEQEAEEGGEEDDENDENEDWGLGERLREGQWTPEDLEKLVEEAKWSPDAR